MAEERKQKGGARPGAGAKPKADSEKAKSRTITLSDADWEVFKNNGGTKTLRRLIRENEFK